MDLNEKIQLGHIQDKLDVMKSMSLSDDEINGSFSKSEKDLLQKAMNHKYIRKEGNKYIYDEPKGDLNGNKWEGPHSKLIENAANKAKSGKLSESELATFKNYQHLTEDELSSLPESVKNKLKEIGSAGEQLEKKEENSILDSITENNSVEDIRHKLFDLTNQDQRMKVTTVSGSSYYTTIRQERLDLFNQSNQQAKAGIKKIELGRSGSPTIQKI